MLANCFAELMDPFRTSTCCLNPHIQALFLPVEGFSEMVILRKLTGGLKRGMGPVEVLTGRVWALKTANESTRNVPSIVTSNFDHMFFLLITYFYIINKLYVYAPDNPLPLTAVTAEIMLKLKPLILPRQQLPSSAVVPVPKQF